MSHLYDQNKNNAYTGNNSWSGTSLFTGAITITDVNIALSTATGTKIGTSTTQKLAFFNSSPTAQIGATTDLGVALSTLGLRAAGTAYPITTSGAVTLGSLTSGRVTFAGASGLLSDDADFTFATDTLTVTKIAKTSFTKGLSYAYVAKTANYTITTNDNIVDCTANSFDITLPTAVGTSGLAQRYVIKNSGTGVITIKTTSSQTIDGIASGVLTLIQWDSLVVFSNNANWYRE